MKTEKREWRLFFGIPGEKSEAKQRRKQSCPYPEVQWVARLL